MSDFLTYFLLFLAVIVFVLIVSFLYKMNMKKVHNTHTAKNLKTQKLEDGSVDFVRCPLCNTPMAKNENMVSRIFRPMNTSDQRMLIMGCPHCYPETKGVRRVCPVCKMAVPEGGHLVARLFNKAEGKKHVIVLGCSECFGKSQNFD